MKQIAPELGLDGSAAKTDRLRSPSAAIRRVVQFGHNTTLSS